MGIEIRLLGDFIIQVDGARAGGLNNSRFQALVAYLALRAPEAVQRSEIAFKLWVDSSEEQALTNLRKILHQARQGFPEENLILSEAHTLQLNLAQDSHLDITEFTIAMETAEKARRINDPGAEQSAFETALAFYRGDLLPNCYDEWLVPERERLRELFIRGADRLIALLEMRKHYRDAIKYAQTLLQVDRLREETYRTLIRLHALNDDRAAALNAYHTFAGLLARELGVEPAASTRELHEQLLKDNSGLPQANPPVTHMSHPLVAREEEWKRLLMNWKQAAGGDLCMTILSGEAGIGKTRLAEDLARWASRQGVHVAAAACRPGKGQISYAPVTSWLRSVPLDALDKRWKNELGRLVPTFSANDPEPAPMTESWQKQVFFEALARALTQQPEPLLLLLDDMQWCDTDTLEWLTYFMRFDRQARVLLLATVRSEELPVNIDLQTTLLDLRIANQLTEIELTRLSREQTEALGAQLLGRILSKNEGLALYEQSEGVPLFVVELAQDGLKAVPVPGSRSGLEGQEPMPPRLRAIMEGRLMRLPSPVRAVAESAAILGREFNLGLLRKISELDEHTTITALDELWRRRIIRERGGEIYDFSHDKLREVTLNGISPVRTLWLNQRAAEALEVDASDETYARIANHFERAGLGSKAAEYYARAANRERNIFALVDALEHLTHASLLEKNRATLAALNEQRGDVLQLLERRAQSFDAFSQALELADRHLQKARLERKLITLVSRQDPETARCSYQNALAELELSKNEPGYWLEWIESQFAWIEACYWQQNAEDLDIVLQKTREPVERFGTLLHKIHFRHRIISSAFVRERYRLGMQHVEVARENVGLAIEANNPYQISTAIRLLGMTAYCANQLEMSEAAYREAIQLCEKNNDHNSLLIARVYISFVHHRLKSVEEVQTDTQLLEETLMKMSKHPQYEGVVQANYAWLAYRAGNMSQARQWALIALETWRPLSNPYPMQWGALFVLLALALDENNLDEVLMYGKMLLSPPQQRLEPEVDAALIFALKENPKMQKYDLTAFNSVIDYARITGYL